MPRYRKKPVTIDAIRVAHALRDAKHDWNALPNWLRDAYEEGTVLFEDRAVGIATMEGHMRGGWDDWIIRGLHGELYPCKPDIFEATYEPVEGE